ncbi:NUDIX domain-containing protein [Candidatus Parcubacteria bacterium]|nr:NUDIX domain-containing protein [Candidatus Parcubacteria bacterium]
MPFEKSAGFVIFRKEAGKIFYLLLHYPAGSRASKDFWEFPKGHIEKGENALATAKRELIEETKIKDLIVIDGFKEWIKYFFVASDKKIFKIVTFFLGETKQENIEISSEHIGFLWVEFPEACKIVSFKNSKKILEKVNYFLSENG